MARSCRVATAAAAAAALLGAATPATGFALHATPSLVSLRAVSVGDRAASSVPATTTTMSTSSARSFRRRPRAQCVSQVRARTGLLRSSAVDMETTSDVPPPVVAAKKKGGAGKPVLAVEGDTLETTPMMVGLVAGSWVVSLMALQPLFAALAAGPSPLQLIQLGFTFFATVVFSDFFSGVFHWSTDNYGNGKTPVFGTVIAAFQGHHSTPWTITHRSFFNNVHKIARSVIPLLMLAMLCTSSPCARLFWVIFLNSQTMSQEFHKLSHMPKPSPFVQWMQRNNLAISKEIHMAHHSSPFEAHYCILTGVCNKALDDANVWRRMEAIIYKINGVEPNCWREEGGEELKAFALSLVEPKGARA